MKFTKKGSNALSGTAMKVVYGFLAIVLVLLLSAELLPEVMNASATVGAIPNLPLAGLFTSGVVVMIIVIGLIVAVIQHSSKINK